MKATPTPMIPPIVSSDRQPPAALLGVSSSSASRPSSAAIPAASARGSRWRPTSGPDRSPPARSRLPAHDRGQARRDQAEGDVDRPDVDGQTEIAVDRRCDDPRDDALRLLAIELGQQAATDDDRRVVVVATEDQGVGRTVVVQEDPRRLDAGRDGQLVDDVHQLDLLGVRRIRGPGPHPEREAVAADRAAVARRRAGRGRRGGRRPG